MVGTNKKKVIVVAGIGNSTGTGAATVRAFTKAGYDVAFIGRTPENLHALAKEITEAGGYALAFPIQNYSNEQIESTWHEIRNKFSSDKYVIAAAVWNTGHGVWKPFLDITPEEIRESLQVNIEAAFSFSRYAIKTFKDNEIDPTNGARGTLIFTGATASLRGNVTTSAFAAGKFGLRALSQSLSKEFGKQDIHVAHVIIDGGILTDRSRERRPDWDTEDKKAERLSPESIAQAYLYLVNQDQSAWTWELDLRPAHEKW
ncbi:short-chain dehydrogenase/reductase SDR [Phlegmacium glaucopus]|nr:short-chain dehydrogenase/reductase SDR [Phlegmacium glaucopus]